MQKIYLTAPTPEWQTLIFGIMSFTNNFGGARHSVHAVVCQIKRLAGRGLLALSILPSLFVKGIIPLILLGYFTGARLTDCVVMKWENIQPGKNLLVLPLLLTNICFGNGTLTMVNFSRFNRLP